jgi:peptide/nickel transport system substrate-binding protein
MFHNGKTLGADDVVASLNRWGRVSPQGQWVYPNVEAVSASGADTVVMKFKAPYAPLLAFLAHPPGGAAIMPKEIADVAGPQSLRQYVGTGPYRFVEWAPDRYVHLVRFDRYAARIDPPSGYGGRKDALADEIYYYPVTEAATRIAGVQSSAYDIADIISQDAYNDLVKDPRVDPGPIPGSYLFFFLNKRQGLMTNVKLRQAIAAALDMGAIQRATFGNPALYTVDASIYPKGTTWHTEAGADLYNLHDVDRARALAKEAGYAGQPVRWLTTQDYDYMFKSTVVAAAQLQRAGFRVDMQVLDWASVLDHRARPADWDVMVASQSRAADPSLVNVFNSAYPGWWDTRTKNSLMARFDAESDPARRVRLWAEMQALMYQEAPVVALGGWSVLVLSRKGLPGFRPSHWIVPWNVQAVK